MQIGTSPSFKDHFSGHAGSYAEYRPTYPLSLFEFLAGLCRRRELAWDCATGNGQAALQLTDYFGEVVATDASRRQIEAAVGHPRLKLRVATAEDSGQPSASVQLITVAQALHWFDIDAFFSEAARVLAPQGVLAVWCYERCSIDRDCDAAFDQLLDEVEPYWPPERAIVDKAYRDIDLPFVEIDTPQFEMQASWTVDDMLGYLRTWSASQRYQDQAGQDAVALVEEQFTQCWGDARKIVRWPLELRVSRKQ